MSSSESRLRLLLMEYENKRNDAEYMAAERKKILYEKIPELQLIEESRGRVGLLAMRKVVRSGGNTEKLKEEMEITFKQLGEREEEIYKQNNIPLDYLDVKYECAICKDRGILETGGKCKCLEQKIIESLYDKSNMKNLIMRENFDTMDKSLYSSEPNSAGDGRSQRELMEENIKHAEEFIKNMDDPEKLNLVFYGPTGSGKTFLSSCIAERVIKKGYTVMYKPCSELMQLASKNQFNKYEEDVSREYDRLYSCDLLIIDDLGTELNNKFFTSEIYKLINARMVAGKKFIISTNYSPAKINEVYTSRVSYRLLESCKMLKFEGNNIRVAKLGRNK